MSELKPHDHVMVKLAAERSKLAVGAASRRVAKLLIARSPELAKHTDAKSLAKSVARLSSNTARNQSSSLFDGLVGKERKAAIKASLFWNKVFPKFTGDVNKMSPLARAKRDLLEARAKSLGEIATDPNSFHGRRVSDIEGALMRYYQQLMPRYRNTPTDVMMQKGHQVREIFDAINRVREASLTTANRGLRQFSNQQLNEMISSSARQVWHNGRVVPRFRYFIDASKPAVRYKRLVRANQGGLFKATDLDEFMHVLGGDPIWFSPNPKMIGGNYLSGSSHLIITDPARMRRIGALSVPSNHVARDTRFMSKAEARALDTYGRAKSLGHNYEQVGTMPEVAQFDDAFDVYQKTDAGTLQKLKIKPTAPAPSLKTLTQRDKQFKRDVAFLTQKPGLVSGVKRRLGLLMG